MGTLIILFMLSFLMEGVLRKWLLNPLEKPLFFVREPFLLAIYYFYWKVYGIRTYWAVPFALYMLFILLIIFAQNIYWQYPLLVPLLAIRYFIFYIPLAFVMRDVATEDMLRRIVRFFLISAIPIGALVILQFMSPPASPINRAISGDADGVFLVTLDIVRPYGPFTFAIGQNYFAAFMLALVLIAIEKRRAWGLTWMLLVPATLATLCMGALSGGRTYFIVALAVWAFYILAGFTCGRPRVGATRTFYAVAIFALFTAVFVIVFPAAYESMSARQARAVNHEGSTAVRALSIFSSALDPLSDAPIFGRGLGSGVKAASASVGQTKGFLNGETEWQRFIYEFGPVFGFPMLLLRALAGIALLLVALGVNRRYGDGCPLIMLGFALPVLETGQISMQNQMLAFAWISFGLVIAMANVTQRRHREQLSQ